MLIQAAKIQNGSELSCLLGNQEVHGVKPLFSVLRVHNRHSLFLQQGLNLSVTYGRTAHTTPKLSFAAEPVAACRDRAACPCECGIEPVPRDQPRR